MLKTYEFSLLIELFVIYYQCSKLIIATKHVLEGLFIIAIPELTVISEVVG